MFYRSIVAGVLTRSGPIHQKDRELRNSKVIDSMLRISSMFQAIRLLQIVCICIEANEYRLLFDFNSLPDRSQE